MPVLSLGRTSSPNRPRTPAAVQQIPSEWRIKVAGAETTALYEPASTAEGFAILVCAHGAGGRMDDRSMTKTAEVLRSRGIGVVRFNFLYSERGSRRPDTMPSLKQCYSAVVTRAREELVPKFLLIGGRSMGGRVGSMLAAEGFACDGLLLLAYPLHPAGQPEKLRDGHLKSIGIPTLCLNGTRDPLCRQELMDVAVAKLGANWTMHWVDDADHSFHVRKSSGRTDADVMREIGEATSIWLSQLRGPHDG